MTRRQLEQLLKHHSFLRALALRLLRDAQRADDVVQDAWLVALKSPKSPNEVRRGWLAGIVRNLVRRARRDDERRARRERLAARNGTVRAADEIFSERSVRRRVAQLVLDLPEHYREAILLRYYEGLPPLSIARRLDLSSSTVRTRLQRGLTRLRHRLEAEHGGRRVLGALLLPLLAPRATGAALKATAAAAVLVALGLSLFSTRNEAGRDVARAASAHAATRAHKEPGSTVPTVAVTGPGSRPLPARPHVLGTVHLPNGVTTRDVSIEIGRIRAVVKGGQPFQVPVDGLRAPLTLGATHPETEPKSVAVKVNKPFEIRLVRRLLVPEELPPSARDGRDAAGGGAGAAGARRRGDALDPASLAHFGGAGTRLSGIVWMDEEGAVKLEVCHGDRCLRRQVAANATFAVRVDALLRGGELPASLRVRATHADRLPGEVDVPVLVDPETNAPLFEPFEITLDAARTVTGAVELAEGGAADGATIAVFTLAGETPYAATAADADGRFEIAVEKNEPCYLVAAVAGHEPVGVEVDDFTELGTLTLRRGATITGRAPAGAQVRAATVEPTGTRLVLAMPVRRTGERLFWQEASTRVAADGRYALGGLGAALYEVSVATETQHVRAPGTADFDPPLARLSVVVRGSGLPLASATVQLAGLERSTDAAGRVEVELLPGTYAAVAAADGFEPASRAASAPGQVVFDLSPKDEKATVVVTLLGHPGVPLPAACDFLLAQLGGDATVRQERVGMENGRFYLRDVDAGSYLLAAYPGGWYFAAGEPVTLAAGATVPVTLELDAGGRIAVEVFGSPYYSIHLAGGDHTNHWQSLLDMVGQGVSLEPSPIPVQDGFWMSPLLMPGRHVVLVTPWDPNEPPRSLEADVLPGGTVYLDVTLDR